MAEVKWSDDVEFVPQTSLGATDEIMGLTSSNVNAKYPSSLFITSSTNKESGIYVSKLGNDTTGTGTFNNPYLTCLKANSVAVYGSTIYVDSGTYAESNFQFKAGVNWVGSNRDLVNITMASAALDTVGWAAATSPFLYFSDLTLTFSAFNFQPTALKTSSAYKFNNCLVTGTANLRLVSNMVILNSTFATLNAYYIENSESRNSRYSTLLAIRAGLILQVNSIVFNSDGDWLTNVNVLNDVDGTLITSKFTNAMNQMTGLTIDMNSQDATVLYADIASIALPNLITIVNPGTLSPIFPVEEVRLLSTGHGFANYTDHGNSFWYGGPTGTTANTLVMGRNIGGNVAVSDAVVFGFASCDKQSTFIAWDFSNPITRGKAAQEHQFVAKFTNGIGFQTDNPQANFHVKEGASGTLLLSATGAVADGNISASELNPYITSNNITFKSKTDGGLVQYAYVPVPVEVNGSSLSLVAGCEYIANSGGLVTFTLPVTAAVGDKYRVVGKSASFWRIAQNASQTIFFLDQTTTTGTGGSITSTQRYQTIEIECITTNTEFSVTYGSGASYTVV